MEMKTRVYVALGNISEHGYYMVRDAPFEQNVNLQQFHFTIINFTICPRKQLNQYSWRSVSTPSPRKHRPASETYQLPSLLARARACTFPSCPRCVPLWTSTRGVKEVIPG